MNTKIALARTLVRNTNLAASERRQRLNQLTADVHREYDHEIGRIRSEIAGLGMTGARAAWRTLVGLMTGVPFSRSEGVASIARLRVQLAEKHTAKFAALAELKIIKTLV
jgi:hypothetical protein